MASCNAPVLLVRLHPGIVGETRRTVHVVPLPEDRQLPEHLTAYCGEQFEPGTIEHLSAPTGMPCIRCLTSTASTIPPPPAGI